MSRSRLLGLAVATLLTAGVFAGLYYFVPSWPTTDQWRQLVVADRIPAIVTFFLFVNVGILLRGTRWHMQLRGIVKADRPTIMLTMAWCFLLLNVLPFRFGDLVRLGWVRKWGGSIVHAAGALISERVADAFVLMLFAGAALLFLPALPDWVDSFAWVYLAACVSAYGTIVVASPYLYRRLSLDADLSPESQPAPRRVNLRKHVGNFVAGLATDRRADTQAIQVSTAPLCRSYSRQPNRWTGSRSSGPRTSLRSLP